LVDFAEVKSANPIEKVVALLNIEVTKQRNGQLRGCCPIHGGNDPRGFVITPAKGLWYCFKGCGGGDGIALVAKVKKISPKEAAEWLSVGGTVQEPVPDRVPVPQSGSGFKELDYLEPDHAAVDAVGFDVETAKALGIGHAPKGILRGTVAIPIRLSDGTLAGYIGITEALLPSRWHLPTQKVVPLRPKKMG
jgi:DNA primase